MCKYPKSLRAQPEDGSSGKVASELWIPLEYCRGASNHYWIHLFGNAYINRLTFTPKFFTDNFNLHCSSSGQWNIASHNYRSTQISYSDLASNTALVWVCEARQPPMHPIAIQTAFSTWRLPSPVGAKSLASQSNQLLASRKARQIPSMMEEKNQSIL